MSLRGYPTSFTGMFGRAHGDSPAITSVEIPMIQRDYAQGREDPGTADIRGNFLDALLDALTHAAPISLDFVYGRVTDRGVFHPLDGQQRLTTLFLLHWYLASLTGHLDASTPWAKFSYSTRPSARRFCEQLAENPLPATDQPPSEWITDQHWYQFGWRFDPTIASMLVMIDAIAEKINAQPGFDAARAWGRLTDPETPAISFYLLPLGNMYSDEDLYITMNSRGRPLTDFENFKAQFEQIISHSPRAEEFSQRMDGEWADLMWRLDDGDRIIDDEFLRYFTFLIEVCEFRERLSDGDGLSLVARADRIFAHSNERAQEHLDFVFDAFDTWTDAESVDGFFATYFSNAQPGDEGYDPNRIRIFGGSADEDSGSEQTHPSRNLLRFCLQRFGDRHGDSRMRAFTLGHSLMLYGILMHRLHSTDDFRNRLRTLRNFVGASEGTIRTDLMGYLFPYVERVIIDGDIAGVKRFSGHQRAEELRKQTFLGERPDLRPVLNRLEDQRVLEGNLSVFDLEPAQLEHRAEAFERVFRDDSSWLPLTGALLASGDYFRAPYDWVHRIFGTSRGQNFETWRILFTAGPFDDVARTRSVLMPFLDRLDPGGDLAEQYTRIMGEFLHEREERSHLDWRYYLVKYDAMRTGHSGRYASEDVVPGYRMAMLHKTRMNSNYRDPFLYQLWLSWRERTSPAEHRKLEDPWFTGYEHHPRWLTLTNSGIGIRCVTEGYEIRPPADTSQRSTFEAACDSFPYTEASDDLVLVRIPQKDSDEGPVDTEDRITVGVRFLKHLVSAGL